MGLENLATRHKCLPAITPILCVTIFIRVHECLIAQNEEHLVVAQQVDHIPTQRARRGIECQQAFKNLRTAVWNIANLQSVVEMAGSTMLYLARHDAFERRAWHKMTSSEGRGSLAMHLDQEHIRVLKEWRLLTTVRRMPHLF